eukprot:UC1_evm1s1955
MAPDYRVTDRVPRSFLTVAPSGPLFSEFDSQVGADSLAELDRPLSVRERLQEVYTGLFSEGYAHIDEEWNGSTGVDIPHELDDLSACFYPARALLQAASNNNASSSTSSKKLRLNPKLEGVSMDALEAITKSSGDGDGVCGSSDGKNVANTLSEATSLRPPPPPRGRTYLQRPSRVVGDQANREVARLVREYAAWLRWWRNTLTIDDFREYTAEQQTDFIGPMLRVHALLSTTEPEPETKVPAPPSLSAHILEHAPKPRIRVPGHWVSPFAVTDAVSDAKDSNNAAAVVATASSGIDNLTRTSSITSSSSSATTTATDTTDTEKRTTTVCDSTCSNNDGSLVTRANDDVVEHYGDSTTSSGHDYINNTSSDAEAALQRMNEAWDVLKMPRKQRIDLAIKYSSRLFGITKAFPVPISHNDDGGNLSINTTTTVAATAASTLATPADTTTITRATPATTAITNTTTSSSSSSHSIGESSVPRSVSVFAAAATLWEVAAARVSDREKLLGRLEAFERRASDPARLFSRGNATRERLSEAQTRAVLDRELAAVDIATRNAVDAVKDELDDAVTYDGRPYHDKMVTDV